MSNLFKNKKGIWDKIIILMIMLFVVMIVWSSFSKNSDALKILDAAQIYYDNQCEISDKYCDKVLKNCNDEECSSDEESILKLYSEIKDCDYYEDSCSKEEEYRWNEFKERLEDLKSDEKSSLSNSNYENVLAESEAKKVYEELDLDKVISKYSTIDDINKIKSIILIETKSNPLDTEGHPTLRFECHKFNKYVGANTMPCTINSGESFSRVSSETNKDAFMKAKEIDERSAILSTSFGFGQIMGFNYQKAGYDSPEKFYKDMFDPEKQIAAMINFIESTPVLKNELDKENTDWSIIARNYNGPAYAENSYDEKLEDTFKSLS
ncbi:MAG: N-acetylmuramidase domain-containing protein [Candidatus Woesearchaeota archaeon]|jgi:hypothetical protein|nr:N-acetylmuramidase domain-containing protein [Candidatus Woesearchaeota archaeon]